MAIETDEETPLKAKSSVLYIALKGLAFDGTDESVERRAIIKSVFSDLTGCLALKGKLCKGEDYVAPMSAVEYCRASPKHRPPLIRPLIFKKNIWCV